MAAQAMPFEWHALEGEGEATFRWTGPSSSATIDLPVIFDRDLLVRIQAIAMLRPKLVDSIKLSMYGQPLAFEIDRSQPLFGLVTRLRRAEIAETDRDFGITIEVPVTRPFDVGARTAAGSALLLPGCWSRRSRNSRPAAYQF